MSAPWLAWYGDDFTGSAAVLDALASAGIEAVLFLVPPGEALWARFAGAQAVGLAGTARSHGPAWMDAALPGVFDWLAGTGARLVHYKICSTLDSSPGIGSIGRAVDIAQRQLASSWVPCLAADPSLGRHQCYGTLFARGPGGVHRLDRHPVMARHPVTPMDEADVGRHLARQTDRPIGLVDLDGLAADPAGALRAARGGGAEIVLLDAQREADMASCGRLIWEEEARLVVGSQGVERALIAHWRATGTLGEAPAIPGAGPARTAVVSGSVSAVTAAQIARAAAAGFAPIPADAGALAAGGAEAEAEVARAAREAIAVAAAGADPLVHTARGPDDPAVAAARARVAALGLAPEAAAARVGEALGEILRAVLRASGLRRAVLAGGDTSGHAGGRLGIEALTALAPVQLGASLFAAHGGAVDGLQIAFKGGQMGGPDVFERLRAGG